jgi:hypothetical protein
MCQYYLADQQLYQMMEKVDADLAEKVRLGGCLWCPGKLHRSNYKRKPRGGAPGDDEAWRHSFSCDQEGCRKRHTPPSVRFLGRRVYWGLVVVLASAMRHGLTPERVNVLRESLGMDRRTLERWRQWWLETFESSPFWKAARAFFSQPVDGKTLPWSLCEVFDVKRRDRLLALLKFLSPITTGSIPLERTF